MGHAHAKTHLVPYAILAFKMLLAIYVKIVIIEKKIDAFSNVDLKIVMIVEKIIV
jgi:hypothetical protein